MDALGSLRIAVAKLDQPAHVARIKPRQRDPLADAEQLAELLFDPRRPVDLGLAVSGDRQHPHVCDLAREEQQRQQRQLIRGVHVVQHDDQRLPVGAPAQEAREGVEQHEPRLLGVELELVAQLRQRVAELGHHLREPGRSDAQIDPQLVGVAASDQRPDDRDPRPHGRGAAAVPAPSPGDLELWAGRLRLRAGAASSVTSRVLPIPASPPISSSEPAPPRARTSASRIAASSAVRSRNGSASSITAGAPAAEPSPRALAPLRLIASPDVCCRATPAAFTGFRRPPATAACGKGSYRGSSRQRSSGAAPSLIRRRSRRGRGWSAADRRRTRARRPSIRC